MKADGFKKARAALGLTQRELGKLMGMTTQSVANKENGRSPVTQRDIHSLERLSIIAAS